MTVNMYIATLAWLLLLTGAFLHRRRNVHVPIMLSGITLDVVLVLYLQVTREAVQTALRFELGILPQLHIATSSLSLALYFPIILLGAKILRGDQSPTLRRTHRRLALTALTLRTLGFFLMFSMLR